MIKWSGDFSKDLGWFNIVSIISDFCYYRKRLFSKNSSSFRAKVKMIRWLNWKGNLSGEYELILNIVDGQSSQQFVIG